MDLSTPASLEARPAREEGSSPLFRLRQLFMLTLLAALLFLTNLLVGCTKPEREETPAVYYGPPPADLDSGGVDDASEPDPNDAGGEDPVVYYGPQPNDAGGVDDASEPIPNDAGGEDVPLVYYGPQPIDAGGVDAATDATPTDAAQADVPMVYYGPVPVDAGPVDAASDAAPADVSQPDVPMAFYGPAVIDAGPADACIPRAVYGPQPCNTDQECVDRHGPGWYCDENNAFEDGCGGENIWPMCRQN